MKSLALRTMLAGLLIVTVVGKIWRTPVTEADLRYAVLSLVALNGWPAHEEGGDAGDPLGKSITFQATGCDLSGSIFLVHLSLQAAPMLDHAVPPSHARRFVYLGRTWLTEDRWGMRREWLKQKALSLFGLGRYAVNDTVLVVAEPRDCTSADKIDWSTVWARRAQQAHLSSRKL